MPKRSHRKDGSRKMQDDGNYESPGFSDHESSKERIRRRRDNERRRRRQEFDDEEYEND